MGGPVLCLDMGESGHSQTLTCWSRGAQCSCSLGRCCGRSTTPRQPTTLQGQEQVSPQAWTGNHPRRPVGHTARTHTCLTWPPQVPAPLGWRGAVPIIAVALWAGRAVLLEGILRAHWLLAIAVLLKVTAILLGATHLTGQLHLAQWSEAHHGTSGHPNRPSPTALSPASLGPSSPCATLGAQLRWGPALTLHPWQQPPWAHSAPSASRQVVALQHWFRQSWGQGFSTGRSGLHTGQHQAPEQTRGPYLPPQPTRPGLHGEATAAPSHGVPYGQLWVSQENRSILTCGHGHVGGAPGGEQSVVAGMRHCTSGGPQSHCSPRSTNPFPHTGPPTSRSGSGAFTTQFVRGFSMNISRLARLQWLNILGNLTLREEDPHQGRVAEGRPPTSPGTPLCSWPSARVDPGESHPILAAMTQPPLSCGMGQ